MVSPVRSSIRTPAGLLAVFLIALSLGVAGWLFVRYPGVLVSGVANPDPTDHVDFETFWRSTSALLHGRDLYHTGSVLKNLNPPFLSLLLAPFGLLPVMPSYWLFTTLSVVLATGTILVSARELRLNRAATVFAVVSLLASSPLHGTLLLGQIYVLLMAGLAAAWLAGRRGRPGWAAIFIALVVALKPSLAPLLLVPLCWRGHPARWSSVAIGVGATAGFSLAGVLVAGPASATDWLHLAMGTPAPEFDANSSLPGVLARVGAPGALGWVVTVTVVLGTLWWVRRSHPVGRMPPGAVGPVDTVWFAVAAGCLLASPIAWLNYWILLWPGLLVLLRAGRWWAAVPLITGSIIPVAWANLWQAEPHTPVALAGRSLYCGVLLGFWVALAAYSRARGDPEPVPVDETDPARADTEVVSSASRSD